MVSSNGNETETFDSSSKIINLDICKKQVKAVDGTADDFLQCVATTTYMRIPCRKAPVMYLMCKATGYWSIFGLSKFCQVSRTSDYHFSFAYYLQIIKYISWINEVTKSRYESIKDQRKQALKLRKKTTTITFIILFFISIHSFIHSFLQIYSCRFKTY